MCGSRKGRFEVQLQAAKKWVKQGSRVGPNSFLLMATILPNDLLGTQFFSTDSRAAKSTSMLKCCT